MTLGVYVVDFLPVISMLYITGQQLDECVEEAIWGARGVWEIHWAISSRRCPSGDRMPVLLIVSSEASIASAMHALTPCAAFVPFDVIQSRQRTLQTAHLIKNYRVARCLCCAMSCRLPHFKWFRLTYQSEFYACVMYTSGHIAGSALNLAKSKRSL